MKTSLTIRIVALIAAASTTFALFQSVALIGHPAPDAAVQIAQTSAPAPK